MQLHALLPAALLVGLAYAKPISQRSRVQRQVTNASLSGITPVRTDESSTAIVNDAITTRTATSTLTLTLGSMTEFITLTTTMTVSTNTSTPLRSLTGSGVYSTPSTPLTNSSTCIGNAAPPAPTHPGIVSGCAQWYVAVPGDTCVEVASSFGLPVDTFFAWNPSVESAQCPNMLAGDAYCVASCAGTNATTGGLTLTASSTAAPSSVLTTFSSLQVPLNTSVASLTPTGTSTVSLASATSTASAVDVYKMYMGDGSVGDGWPSQTQWIDFDYLFEANTPKIKASCAAWGVPDNSDDEMDEMKSAILDIASSTGVDERFILAIIMQESTGCVRVITTEYSVPNPGLMQSHNGTGSCNFEDTVQTPCAGSQIHQQIEDGTAGTQWGDGLQQCLENQSNKDVSQFYRAARMYNGGSIANSGNLGEGCCTACYASDIANRLTGWVNAPHDCTL